MKTVLKHLHGEIIALAMIGENDEIPDGYSIVPIGHPDSGAISVLTHYVNADGQVVKYPEPLARQRLQGRPEHHVWDVNVGWVDQSPVNVLKTTKREAINAERVRLNELPILYLGNLFDADATAQRNVSAWMTNIAAGQDPPVGFTWRGYDNVDHPADASFVVGLGNAITLRGTYLYQRSWVKKAELDALVTADQVRSYDVTTGW